MATKTLIGADVRRREDPALVQGAGRFVDDLAPPRLVFASVLRSPHAHARLRRLDTMRAAAIPGVVRVITARDVDGTVDPEPAVGIPPAARRPARPLLARDVVRYVGEPVAVVAAEDRYVAADACEQIDAEYDPQPAVSDLDAALAPGAPRVHAQFPDNVALTWSWSEGEVDGAFARAHTVVRLRVENQRLADEALCAWAALRVGRPVKLVLTRREDLLATTQGRGQINDVEAAVAADGTVLALRARTVADLGAYF